MYLTIKSYTLTPRATLTPIQRGYSRFKRYSGGHDYITLLGMKSFSSILYYYYMNIIR